MMEKKLMLRPLIKLRFTKICPAFPCKKLKDNFLKAQLIVLPIKQSQISKLVSKISNPLKNKKTNSRILIVALSLQMNNSKPKARMKMERVKSRRRKAENKSIKDLVS